MKLHQTDGPPRIGSPDTERWLTVAQAAAFLRITVSAATGAVARGELPISRDAHGTVVDRVALLNLMRQTSSPADRIPRFVTAQRFDGFIYQQGKEAAS